MVELIHGFIQWSIGRFGGELMVGSTDGRWLMDSWIHKVVKVLDSGQLMC